VFRCRRHQPELALVAIRGLGHRVEVGGRALRDAQVEGLVRADVTPDDIMMIATLLRAGLRGDLAERRALSLRTRAIVLSGLKAHP